jgi:hypothetical protein
MTAEMQQRGPREAGPRQRAEHVLTGGDGAARYCAGHFVVGEPEHRRGGVMRSVQVGDARGGNVQRFGRVGDEHRGPGPRPGTALGGLDELAGRGSVAEDRLLGIHRDGGSGLAQVVGHP